MRRPNRRPALSERDLQILDIERRWGPEPGSLPMKLYDARELLGLEPSAYALLVNGLVEDPAARAHDAETIDNLRAARDQHRRAHGVIG